MLDSSLLRQASVEKVEEFLLARKWFPEVLAWPLDLLGDHGLGVHFLREFFHSLFLYCKVAESVPAQMMTGDQNLH
jgi:hypothetical protein